jgi:hypothetical protein
MGAPCVRVWVGCPYGLAIDQAGDARVTGCGLSRVVRVRVLVKQQRRRAAWALPQRCALTAMVWVFCGAAA